MDLSAPNVGLAVILGVCSYLHYRCSKSPNPPPAKPYEKDRLGIFKVDTKPKLFLVALYLALTSIYQAALMLFPNRRSEFCLNPNLLNEGLLSWSGYTVTFIVFVSLGALVRLMAYAHLGQNFTYALAKPTHIIKNGIYGYVQHPSYTGIYLLLISTFFSFSRVDGVGACLLPSSIVRVNGMNIALWVLTTSIAILSFSVRVRDEEEMLEKEFGKEWVDYHKVTARFIPGVI